MSEQTSYKEIVKSTSIIGVATAIYTFLNIVRTMILFRLLSVASYGVFGVFNSIANWVTAVSGLGIGNSGVREIADAAAAGDETRMMRMVATLRRASIVTGLLGLVILAGLAFPLTSLSFSGSYQYGWDLVLLSVSIFFTAVSAGQIALINGLRRMRELAMLTIIGALAGTLITVPLVWIWRVHGIAPSMVAVTGVTMLASWWYARKIKVKAEVITWRDVWREAGPLLKLGFAFIVTGVLSTGALLVIRVLVQRYLGNNAQGLYSAAYQLSGLYVGIILGAMGRDFFPRLTGAAADPVRRTRLVNEQIQVGVLLATPGVLATLGLCSWVLRILAGTRYLGAVSIVQWQIIGVFVQTMSWPIGYVLLAKADGRAYIWSEVATTIFYVGFVFVAIRLWGLEGAGIGFLMMEGFHWLLTYLVVKWRHGLSFSRDNIVLCLVSLPMLAAVFLAARFAPSPWGTIVAVVVTLASLAYSMVALGRLLGEPAHRVALRSLKRLAPRRQRGAA